jgi:hypothetical protein
MSHHKRISCRVCGGHQLDPFLSLGPTPLANSFLRSPDEFIAERYFPLDVYFCETCSLVQLLDVIDPELLFSKYIYVTGTSDTVAMHNVGYAKKLIDLLHLGMNDLVVEVGSNDGSLLKNFQIYGIETLGVEPAVNIAEIANAQGVRTINTFFNYETARKIREKYGPARVVIGNNVLAHVDDVKDFLNGFKALLTDDGLISIEVPYLRELFERLEYDTIYHEHLSYYSVSTLIRLCDTVGLSIIGINRVPVHGGSICMTAGLPEKYGGHTNNVLEFVKEEHDMGLTANKSYQRFGELVDNNRQSLLGLLASLKNAGKTIAGYGAPAKGNTLLNFCGIDTSQIPYTVDKNPMKVGLYTPGMHIPVLPVSALLERQPDYVLILAWNFADEIIEQQQDYRRRGGQFIIPIPEPKVL